MEYEKDGNFEQAIETYTTAIICWYEIKYKLWSITREITARLLKDYREGQALMDFCYFFNAVRITISSTLTEHMHIWK